MNLYLPVLDQAREVALEAFQDHTGPADELVDAERLVEKRQEPPLRDREAMPRRGQLGIAGGGSCAEGGRIEGHGSRGTSDQREQATCHAPCGVSDTIGTRRAPRDAASAVERGGCRSCRRS